MIQLYGTLQLLGLRLEDAVRRRANGDRGQTAAEYMGIIVIIGIIIAAIHALNLDTTIANAITTAINKLTKGN